MSEQLWPERLRRISRLPQEAPASARPGWIGWPAEWASRRANELLDDLRLRVAVRSQRRAARARARSEVPGRPGRCRRHARSAAVLAFLAALAIAPWVAVLLDPSRVDEWTASREAQAAVAKAGERSQFARSVSSVAAARGRAGLAKRRGATPHDGSRRPFAGGVVAPQPAGDRETARPARLRPSAASSRPKSSASAKHRAGPVRVSKLVATGVGAAPRTPRVRRETAPAPPRTGSPGTRVAPPATTSTPAPPSAATSAPPPPPQPAPAAVTGHESASSPPPQAPVEPPPPPQGESQKRPSQERERGDDDERDDERNDEDGRRDRGDDDDRRDRGDRGNDDDRRDRDDRDEDDD